jgi:hypothetical protein
MGNLIITIPKKESTKLTLLMMLKELGVKFQITSESPYGEKFNQKISSAEKDIKLGRSKKVSSTDNSKFLQNLIDE